MARCLRAHRRDHDEPGAPSLLHSRIIDQTPALMRGLLVREQVSFGGLAVHGPATLNQGVAWFAWGARK